LTSAGPDLQRAAIQTAADRLLAGTPLRSTGELTVVQLAAEAGMKRWLLTHKHRDLAEQFQARVKAVDGDPPSVRKLKARVQELQEALTRLRAEQAERQALLECYAHVINELSIDYEQVKAERDNLLGNVRRFAGRHPQT
jgi:DNA repair exonuclease SbcCD ATPase subunit